LQGLYKGFARASGKKGGGFTGALQWLSHNQINQPMKNSTASIITRPAVSFDTFSFPDLEPQALGIMFQIVSLSIGYAEQPYNYTFIVPIN
jgi:hypothetical protein